MSKGQALQFRRPCGPKQAGRVSRVIDPLRVGQHPACEGSPRRETEGSRMRPPIVDIMPDRRLQRRRNPWCVAVLPSSPRENSGLAAGRRRGTYSSP
jgi:hypothetical protein